MRYLKIVILFVLATFGLAACGSVMSSDESLKLLERFEHVQEYYRTENQAIAVIVVPDSSCKVLLDAKVNDVHVPDEDYMVKFTLSVPQEGKEITFRTICGEDIKDRRQNFKPGTFWGLIYNVVMKERYEMKDSTPLGIFNSRNLFMWTLDVLRDVSPKY